MKKTLLFLAIIFIMLTKLKAQEKALTLQSNNKLSVADSLFLEISNTVYYAFYTPSYMATKTPTFTMLKIDIDRQGKVTSMGFSDSADSSFVKAWLTKLKKHDEKATFERYAQEKSYKDISILIPVSFEPNLPDKNPHFTYDQIESLLKFNKKNFTGKSIILKPMFITVLSEHNM